MTRGQRRAFTVASGAVLAVLISLVVTAQVPMDQEPHHHLVFQNDALRIFEPAISPGDTTLDHIHSRDSVNVCIRGSIIRSRVLGAEWSEPGSPCSPGRVTVDEYVGRQMIHRVQNLGTSPFGLVSIENLRDNGWSSSEPLSAAFTKIVQETRAFRIYEVSLHSSNDETLHFHSCPAIVILVSGGLIVSRGDQKEFLDQPGRWSVVAAGDSHRLTVGPSGEAFAVEVDVR